MFIVLTGKIISALRRSATPEDISITSIMNTVKATVFVLTIATTGLLLACQKPNSQTQSASPSPRAAPTSMTGPPGFPPPVMNKPYPGTGVVVRVNRNEGWIEINHEEIRDLMPAMQMEFNVRDKSLLDEVKEGDRVDFTIIETEKGEWLTDIKPRLKPTP